MAGADCQEHEFRPLVTLCIPVSGRPASLNIKEPPPSFCLSRPRTPPSLPPPALIVPGAGEGGSRPGVIVAPGAIW
jgi:hypothetical protein